jgi:hypothetical protein
VADKKSEPKTNDPEVVQSSSLDADKSTYKKNPDPNPEGVKPEPGPSTVQELGSP